MNIMIVSEQRWSNTNSAGNTLSNFFENWPGEDSFSNLYARSGNPTNCVSKDGFQILSRDILINLITPHKIGCVKDTQIEKDQETGDIKREQTLITFIHKTGLKTAYHINNILWRTGIWKNEKLRAYIDANKPDVIFAFAIGVEDNYQLIKYAREITGAKLVLLILDDVLGDDNQKLDKLSIQRRKNARKLIDLADRLYAITEQMSVAYEKILKRQIKVLHKGAVINTDVKN